MFEMGSSRNGAWIYNQIYRPTCTFSTSWRRVVDIHKINREREREM